MLKQMLVHQMMANNVNLTHILITKSFRQIKWSFKAHFQVRLLSLFFGSSVPLLEISIIFFNRDYHLNIVHHNLIQW